MRASILLTAQLYAIIFTSDSILAKLRKRSALPVPVTTPTFNWTSYRIEETFNLNYCQGCLCMHRNSTVVVHAQVHTVATQAVMFTLLS